MNRNLKIDGNGFMGGGQAGYNYLLPSNWLIGFEADAAGTTINPCMFEAGRYGAAGSYTLNYASSLDFLGTARARLGYVLPQKFLVYGTAGLAYGGVNTDATIHFQSGTDNTNFNVHRSAIDLGWTVGAGVEYPVTDRLSVRSEYLYADLGSNTMFSGVLVTGSLNASGNIKAETSAHIIRLALNYAL